MLRRPYNLLTCGCSSTPSSNTLPKAGTKSSLTQLSITHPQIQILWPKLLVSNQNLGLGPEYNMWSKRDWLPNKGLQFYFSWVSFFYQIDFFPVFWLPAHLCHAWQGIETSSVHNVHKAGSQSTWLSCSSHIPLWTVGANQFTCNHPCFWCPRSSQRKA